MGNVAQKSTALPVELISPSPTIGTGFKESTPAQFNLRLTTFHLGGVWFELGKLQESRLKPCTIFR